MKGNVQGEGCQGGRIANIICRLAMEKGDVGKTWKHTLKIYIIRIQAEWEITVNLWDFDGVIKILEDSQ